MKDVIPKVIVDQGFEIILEMFYHDILELFFFTVSIFSTMLLSKLDYFLHDSAPERVLGQIVEERTQFNEHPQPEYIITLFEDSLHNVVPENIFSDLRAHSFKTGDNYIFLFRAAWLQDLLESSWDLLICPKFILTIKGFFIYDLCIELYISVDL